MLILIAGITGNIGSKCAASAIRREHTVRGLGRNPDKLDESIRSKLEGFVTSSSYYDIPALERAVDGVDAVICAYGPIPELFVDGQLHLLRAAERAGVKRFCADAWNMDWTRMQLGDHEVMDPFICFKQHVSVSSSIKPCYVLTGVFVEVFFSVKGHGHFSPANHGVYDPETKTMDVWGTGEEKYDMTTEEDIGEYTIEIITAQDSEKGGVFRVCSGQYSAKDIQKTYLKVRGVQLGWKQMGSLEDLQKTAISARKENKAPHYWGYIGYFYNLYMLKGWAALQSLDVTKYPGVKRTDLEAYLEKHPEV
ncbi:MAG: hypothetical protein M1820_010569 [Bogoriella megaspora]|nr:MAG: hypothetical protein M1820_010569 [Bogoriella megaspora]